MRMNDLLLKKLVEGEEDHVDLEVEMVGHEVQISAIIATRKDIMQKTVTNLQKGENKEDKMAVVLYVMKKVIRK